MGTIAGDESPFICGKMIKDPQKFWGRRNEINQVLTRLYNMESTSIVGERRIGKSSLAYYILSTSQNNFDDTYKFIWLDGQSNHSSSLKAFCAEVTVKGAIEYVHGNSGKECLINFEDAILSSKKKIVLIINEFELLTDSSHQTEFGESFFTTLRYLAEQGDCALVITSKQPLRNLCEHVLGISSPFYNIFLEIPMLNFTDEEANSFLQLERNGFEFTEHEIQMIKGIKNYHHPLILQIACHNVFLNRKNNESKDKLVALIDKQSTSLLNHDIVHKERLVSKGKDKNQQHISKPLDLVLSIFIPILGIGFLMMEFAFLIKILTITQAVLLAIFTSLVGFAVLIFAGRSIDIIGETTFFKLFTQIIEQIPLLSNLLNTITNAVKKMRK